LKKELSMPFCQTCGFNIANEEARFCLQCGAPRAAASPASAGAALQTYDAQPPADLVRRAPIAEPLMDRRPPPPDSKRVAKAAMYNSPETDARLRAVIEGLKQVYRQKMLPLEKMYSFGDFYTPCLADSDFEAKPMVLLIGQYSTGKTSFIRYLLERDYLGIRVGDEPTTDKFLAIMEGDGQDRIIPGDAVAVQADKPFSGLNKFGTNFLTKFEAVLTQSPILSKITFIDTPGVLSGDKQRIGRSYSYEEVVGWFATRCDRILLLFDANKLDISDEMKSAIESIRANDDKIRIILNKCDIPMQRLMRVYGALMWSLGKVFNTPEVLRVYVGSFWDHDVKNEDVKNLLALEHRDLLADLRSLPRNSLMRKINELVKRAKSSKVHAHIMSHLVNQFGFFTNNKNKQEELMKNMLNEFKTVCNEKQLPMGDFPHLVRFRETLGRYQIYKFPKLEEKYMTELDNVLAFDIPRLMRNIPDQQDAPVQEKEAVEVSNPFSAANAPVRVNWVIDQGMKSAYDNKFERIGQGARMLSGAQIAPILMESNLDRKILKKIWDLADITEDGCLDSDEFAVAMYLIELATRNNAREPEDLPASLPENLMPPSKRSINRP
jgi:GTPase SAR1 family protein